MMKELKRIFWVECGMQSLTIKERLVMAYLCLSLVFTLAFVESHFLVFLVLLVNLGVSVRLAQGIHISDIEE